MGTSVGASGWVMSEGSGFMVELVFAFRNRFWP